MIDHHNGLFPLSSQLPHKKFENTASVSTLYLDASSMAPAPSVLEHESDAGEQLKSPIRKLEYQLNSMVIRVKEEIGFNAEKVALDKKLREKDRKEKPVVGKFSKPSPLISKKEKIAKLPLPPLESSKLKSLQIKPSKAFLLKGDQKPHLLAFNSPSSSSTLYHDSSASLTPISECEDTISVQSESGNVTRRNSEVLSTQLKFEDKYQIIKQLGAGGHAQVKLVQNVITGQHVVAKFIRQSSVWHWHTLPNGQKIPKEVALMQTLQLPNVIRFIEFFESNGKYIIVMEYCGNGWVDLYDYVEVYGPVNEQITRCIFVQLVQSLVAMHDLGFSHNDIKDENILIDPQTLSIKLLDFGSAAPVSNEPCSLFYGTKKFASPECLEGRGYLLETQEVWALGSLLYVMLFKADPFRDEKEILQLDIKTKLRRQRVVISQEAEVAVARMLAKSPVERITLREILNLPFCAL